MSLAISLFERRPALSTRPQRLLTCSHFVSHHACVRAVAIIVGLTLVVAGCVAMLAPHGSCSAAVIELTRHSPGLETAEQYNCRFSARGTAGVAIGAMVLGALTTVLSARRVVKDR